jgi:peptidoglycan/LPS O-acetylase OafA/YrhL
VTSSRNAEAGLVVTARRLSPRARAGLDAARAISALYVVAHHLLGSLGAPRIIELTFAWGQEAVIVFFLLSGFVIYANEESRVAAPRGYYLRRLRRIYPPIIAAMLVPSALWALGLIRVDPTWWSALATLLSLQDVAFLKPGVIANPYLGNDPLWSLSYEVFFYLVFPLVMVGWRKSQMATRHAIGAVCVLAYLSYVALPNHFSLVIAYFLLWWAGAMAARAYLAFGSRFSAIAPEVIWLAALAAAAGAAVVVAGYSGPGYYPFLMLRHFGLALGMLVVLSTPLRRVLGAVSGALAWPAALVASISYGLYVLHYPLLVQTHVVGSPWFWLLGVLTIALAVGVERILPRFLPRAPKH